MFLDNPENKPHIDHIDRDKSNNNQDNLRWATISENFLNKDILKIIQLVIKIYHMISVEIYGYIQKL